PQPRGAARSRAREPAPRRQARRRHQAHLRARPVEPLGLVLEYGRVVVFLATHFRAAVRARLPCRARGVSSGGAQPLAAILAVGEAPLSGRRARQSVARRTRHRPASLRPHRAARRWRPLDPTFQAALVCTRELNVTLAWPPSSAAERLERDGKRRDAGFGGFLLQRRDLAGAIGNAAPAPVVFVAPLRLARPENRV